MTAPKLDLDRLEVLARAATAGPWTADDDAVIRDPGGIEVADLGFSDVSQNVAFVAAVSPDVVLALVARVRRLERLTNFVDHEPNCEAMDLRSVECTCGFREALLDATREILS